MANQNFDFQALLQNLGNLDATQRDLVTQALNPPAPAYTRVDAVRDINLLPQAKYINDIDMHRWLDKVMEYDPERLSWHVRRLRGFGGSEIGTLWMSQRDLFHPFHSCTDVVNDKLLKNLPLEPDGNLERGSMLEEPILRVKYRAIMTKKYADLGKTVRFRDDLFPLFNHYRDQDPSLSWLNGTPDEIMEVDGKLTIIDYKAPTTGTLATYNGYAQDDAPVYYKAQLHHYATIAQKLGLEVTALQLASLNYNKFAFDLRDIPLDPVFQKELLDAGTHYWSNFVLRGLPPPPTTSKAFSQEVDLPLRTRELAEQYAVLSVIQNVAKDKREQVQTELNNLTVPIDTSVDVVVSGTVNIEATRTIDHAPLLALLAKKGVETDSVFEPNKLDLNALTRLAKRTLHCDDENDAVFDSLRVKGENGETKTLDVHALLMLARKHDVPLGPYILSESARFSLNRARSNTATELKMALHIENEGLLSHSIAALTQTLKATKDRQAAAVETKASKKPKPAI
jgi:hypothetical protein